QSDCDEMGDTVLPELEVEVGVGKAALRPVLFHDNIPGLRNEVRMPFASPGSSREGLALLHGKLGGVRMLPPLIVAGFPASVRNNEHLDSGLSDGSHNGAQIVEQADIAGDLFHH